MKRVSVAVCSYSSMLEFLSRIGIQQKLHCTVKSESDKHFTEKIVKSLTDAISVSYQLKCNEIDVTFPSIGL